MPPPADPGVKKDDLGFYGMLGVADHPRLDEARATRKDEYPAGGTRHPHRGPLLTEWLAQSDVAAQASCPAHEHWQQQLHLSVRLDRHLELAETGDPARLIALWLQLARGWGRHYAPAMTAVFRCNHGWHAMPSDRECESLFAYTLRSRAWVPVDRAGKPELVRPADAWIDAGATETPRRIRERIPRISDAMYRARGAKDLIEALRLTDVARPAASDLLTLMDAIAGEAAEAGAVSRDAELAARWVQRTLDDILGSEQAPHPQPGQVRLLASHNGALGFVPRPPYADDPLLRDTWEKQRPVLAAEAGLNRLARFLALTRLDDEVRVSAVPSGLHPPGSPAFDAARRKIDRRQAIPPCPGEAESSRNEPRARSALQRLEIVICDDLVLHYEYDGTQATPRGRGLLHRRLGRAGRRSPPPAPPTSNSIPPPAAALVLPRPATGQHSAPGPCRRLHHAPDRPAARPDRMMAERQIRRSTSLRHASSSGCLQRTTIQSATYSTACCQPQAPRRAPTMRKRTAWRRCPSRAMRPSPDAAPPAPVPGTGPEPQDPPKPGAPAVDYGKVQVIDAKPGSLLRLPPQGYVQPQGYGGGHSTAPSADDAENKRVGRRGEEIAFTKEQERIRALGLPAAQCVGVEDRRAVALRHPQPRRARPSHLHRGEVHPRIRPEREFIISKAELELARLIAATTTSTALRAPTRQSR